MEPARRTAQRISAVQDRIRQGALERDGEKTARQCERAGERGPMGGRASKGASEQTCRIESDQERWLEYIFYVNRETGKRQRGSAKGRARVGGGRLQDRVQQGALAGVHLWHLPAGPPQRQARLPVSSPRPTDLPVSSLRPAGERKFTDSKKLWKCLQF